jgi:hypothetical protein
MSSVLTSRFLVTDPNSVLCLHRHRLVNIPQLTKLKIEVRVASRLAIYRQLVRLNVKALETHDHGLFLQLNRCGRSPYVTSSLARAWVFLL